MNTTSKLSQKSEEEEGTEKLIRALTKFEAALSNLGHFQERIYRIAKTIKSIDAHKDCYISTFSIDNEESYIPLEQLYEQEVNYQNNNNYMTVNKEIISFQNAESQENFSYEMADLLSFMENELEIKNNYNKKDCDSSSDEENGTKTTDSSLDLKKQSKENYARMKKNIFNIELRLKAFIQHQKLKENLKSENFESFCAQVKLKTPIKSKIKPNPSFIKNFFEESVKDMEIIKKKRMTLINEAQIFRGLSSNINNDMLIKNINHSEQVKIFQPSTAKKKISDFMVEPIEEQNELLNSKTTKGNIRNSIYKNPYSYDQDGNYLDDEDPILLDKDDVKSVISEEENDEDSQSQYEEIEEEIEVEEEIELEDTKKMGK